MILISRTLIPLTLLAAFVTGCTTSTIYVKDYSVSAPRLQQPLFLTPDTLRYFHRVIASASQFPDSPLEARIGDQPYPLGRNLTWSIPNYCLSLFYERPLSQSFAGFVGWSHSSTSAAQLNTLTLGLGGFLTKRVLAVRLDASSQVGTYSHSAHFVQEVTHGGMEPVTDVVTFESSGTRVAFDWNASLTLNTNSRSLPVNAFVQFTAGTQTLASFSLAAPPSTAGNRTISLDLVGHTFTVTPGISLQVTSCSTLALGAQLIGYTGVDQLTKTRFLSPLIQFSLQFE